MQGNGAGERLRRRSEAEAERLVAEFERSGLSRKEFSAAHGLSVHTLDAWRTRVKRLRGAERIVPVELVEGGDWGREVTFSRAKRQGGQLRVVLPQGLRIEVETGFDAAELRRLVVALAVVPTTGAQSLLV
ncbi:MAG: hypothetical protein ABR905_20785 [Terracidiphilus sp.]|jgi:transposase-like protein